MVHAIIDNFCQGCERFWSMGENFTNVTSVIGQTLLNHRQWNIPSSPQENTHFSSGVLTHWGWATHVCVSKLTIIGSDNGLSPEWRQAIIWTNAGILLIGPLGTNFSEILIEIQIFSLKKIRLKMSSAKCYSFHLGLNVLIVSEGNRARRRL